ncbi:putative gustatory receptor 59d [Drosophila kikkawai]|uniref:Gustatory receptor n=1 Tax=Drosophila kikkawai TaxID=30033 RepID=A0A6P4HTE9_DROKI|nr:putative gustatory receptor 59d [Drosophila kikkawai]
MVDLVKWCLLISYFYGRFTGIINFEIDIKTGRTRITSRATICAACSQLTMFGLLAYNSLYSQAMTSMWSNANYTHTYVFLVIATFRLICVFMALVSRWCQRRHFVRLFNSFRRLYQSNPDIIKYCRRGILSKCICATISETLQVVVALIMMRNQLTLATALGIWAVLSMTAIINVIITQYFIAMAHIRGRYILLNQELRSLMTEARSLVPDRSGVYVTRCCSLADRLERIALAQSDLQALTERLSRTYQLQVLCLVITYYLNLVGNVYLVYSLIKYKSLTADWPKAILVLGSVYLAFYYLDCWLNSYNVFYLLDAHNEMVKLLGLRTLLQPGLDRRLEAVFDNFLLNLSRNPFRLRFFGLFEVNRNNSAMVGNSLLTHSLLLIQYDIQHFKASRN